MAEERRNRERGGAGQPDGDLRRSVAELRQRLGQSDDLMVRRLRLGRNGRRAAVAYLRGVADERDITREIIAPLMDTGRSPDDRDARPAPDGQTRPVHDGQIRPELLVPASDAQRAGGWSDALTR